MYFLALVHWALLNNRFEQSIKPEQVPLSFTSLFTQDAGLNPPVTQLLPDLLLRYTSLRGFQIRVSLGMTSAKLSIASINPQNGSGLFHRMAYLRDPPRAAQ